MTAAVFDPVAPCPCGSGLAYAACCNPERTACAAIELNADANLTPELRAAVNNIAQRPELFLANINFARQRALWVKMSRRWYDDSVFLDPPRILGRCALESDLAFVRTAAECATWQPSAFIFHTAFCGSTLLSQALASAYRCLPLREPEALGSLMYYLKSPTATDADKHAWLDRILRLLARRDAPESPVVVKANDYSNGAMRDVIRYRAEIPVLFMYTPLAEFVAASLRADNRLAWLEDRYAIVQNEIPRLLDVELPKVEKGAYADMAAAYWCYNVATFQRARAERPDQVRSLDFNRMLADPPSVIAACARFFKLDPVPGADLAAVVAKLFGVYSKNSGYRYSPRQREDDLALLLERFAGEVATAEFVARELMGETYPDAGLPGAL